MKPPPKPEIIDKAYRTSGRARFSGILDTCSFDLMFDTNGMPHAVICSYRQSKTTAFYGLDPQLLRPSKDPQYVYEYLGILELPDPQKQ